RTQHAVASTTIIARRSCTRAESSRTVAIKPEGVASPRTSGTRWRCAQVIEESKSGASAEPNEPRVAHESAGSGAVHDLDGLLLEVSRLAARHRDLQSLLCELVALLRRAVPFDRLGVMLHDPARDVMRLHTLAA